MSQKPAFKAAVDARADGLLVTASATLFARAKTVADLAAKSRLPTVYQLRAYVDAGGVTNNKVFNTLIAAAIRDRIAWTQNFGMGVGSGPLPVMLP